MEYTRIDAEARGQAFRKQRALELERAAYALELEVTRLGKIPGESAAQAKVEAAKQAKDRRKIAEALKDFAGVTSAETAKLRKEFREQWATSLELEHLSHAVALEAHLQIHADCSLECPERRDHEDALSVLQSAWEVATEG